MDLKTYNVKTKGLKNLKEGTLALNILRENKLKYSINKLFENNNLRIILTNDYYQMNYHDVKNPDGKACRELASINMDDFDTSNVTNMILMFNGCNNLTSLDLSNLDTSKVTNMSSMFGSCKKLTSLDLSSFDTSKVTNMSSMFSGCTNLTSLDLSNFDTGNVTNMSRMFIGCKNLTTLDLSSFDISNVTDMSWMFNGCKNLTEIKGVIDMKSCRSYSNMFLGCDKLSGFKIKNPPEGFTNHDANTGLNNVGLRVNQYVIVE